MRFSMLFSVFLQITIQIDREIEAEFVLIFECLTFFPIETSSIDVNKEMLWLISDESCLFLHATIDLNFKVKLLIKCFIETP